MWGEFLTVSSFFKPGDLDSRDPSRSRLSIVLRSTFLKCQDYPSCWGQKFFFLGWDFKIKTFQSRLWCVKIVKTHQDCQDASRLSRRIEICQEISTLSRPFESENDEKSRRIEKSQQEIAKIHALLDRDKLLRNAEIFRSRWISRSWSRLFGLDIDVKTDQEQDKLFENVKTNSLTMSRSIETRSSQIETPRLSFFLSSVK